MKKVLLVLLVLTFISLPTQKAHAMSAKGKAFLIMCTYGTVGGALLGFASMAFGTNSRAIAQGASLGLYAGIGFGSYVIASHGKTTDEEPDYPVDQGPPPGYGPDPYGSPGGFGAPPTNGGYGAPQNQGYGGGGYGAPAEQEPSGGFFGGQRYLEIQNDMVFNYRLKNKKGRDFSPPVYLHLVNMQF